MTGDFYKRDNISRQVPGIKDVKSIKSEVKNREEHNDHEHS